MSVIFFLHIFYFLSKDDKTAFFFPYRVHPSESVKDSQSAK